MKKPVNILLVMIVALSFFCAEAVADGDEGTVECRVVQLDAQDLVLIAIENDMVKNIKSIVRSTVRTSKLAGYISCDCAECISSQFDDDIPIADQMACGPTPVIYTDQDGDGSSPPDDCMDDKAAVHPYALWNQNEIPDGRGFDWNCDGFEEKSAYGMSDFASIPEHLCKGYTTIIDIMSVDCGETITNQWITPMKIGFLNGECKDLELLIYDMKIGNTQIECR
jgi:hypothetical protein